MLAELPVELVLRIAAHLNSTDAASVCNTCVRLNEICGELVYRSPTIFGVSAIQKFGRTLSSSKVRSQCVRSINMHVVEDAKQHPDMWIFCTVLKFLPDCPILLTYEGSCHWFRNLSPRVEYAHIKRLRLVLNSTRPCFYGSPELYHTVTQCFPEVEELLVDHESKTRYNHIAIVEAISNNLHLRFDTLRDLEIRSCLDISGYLLRRMIHSRTMPRLERLAIIKIEIEYHSKCAFSNLH